MHGFIAGDNLDIAYPVPWADRLADRNLRAMWSNYQALGHHRLIYSTTISVLVSDELPGAIVGHVAVVGILLTADDSTTSARLAQREVGSALDLHLQGSKQLAVELDASTPPWVRRIVTDGRTVREVATAVLSFTSWL